MRKSASGGLIALDLGATKFAYCLSGASPDTSSDVLPGPVVRVEFPRLGSADREFEVIAQALAADGSRYSGTPVLCAAPNLAGGTVESWPNRPYWRGFPLLPALESVLETRLVAVSDGEAAALADAGNAPGAYYLSLTFGTGVAGGAVHDGDILRLGPLSSEIGHIVTDPRGRDCPCGARGCFQTAWTAFRDGSRGPGELEEFSEELGRLGRILGRVFPRCTMSLGGRFFTEDRMGAAAVLAAVDAMLDGDATAPRLGLARAATTHSAAAGPLLGGLILAKRLQQRQLQSKGQIPCA